MSTGNVMVGVPNNARLRMTDPWLPMTVSRAAIELDHASRGEQVDFEATKRFNQFLRESLHQNVDSGSAHVAWLDANTVDVVGHALIEWEGAAEKVRTVQDVIEHALKVVAEMETASEAEPSPDLTRLRRFCVAFGNSLLAHRATWRNEEPTNPHRR